MKKKILLLLLLIPTLVFAHGGEDHGDAKKETGKAAAYFSNESESDLYELLLKYKSLPPGKEVTLKLFVADFNTNAPIDSAVMQISVADNPNIKLNVRRIEKGIYEIIGIFPEKKSYNLVININSSLGPDLLLINKIEVGKELEKVVASSSDTHWYSSSWFLGIMGLLLGLTIMFVIMKRTNKKVAAGILLLFCILPVATYNTASAHGDEGHGAGGDKGGAASASFDIEKESQFLFGILTEKLSSRDFNTATQALGTVIASPQGSAVIQSPQTGKIISLKVNPGQAISAGQVIAVVEQTIDAGTQSAITAQNSDWRAKRNQAEAEYNAAKIQYARLKSIEDIAAKKDITEAKARLEQAEKNRALYQNIPLQQVQGAKYFNLTSPISGVVGNYNYAVGSFINSGETLLEVTNLNRVFAEVQVFTDDAAQLKNVEKITTSSNVKNDTSVYRLKLISTAQSVNGANQSQKVIFEIINPNTQFKIGENISVNIFSEKKTSQLLIPDEAITEVNGKPAIFVKDKAEQYSISYINKGVSNGKYTAVIQGAEEGERIVTAGAYQMKTIYLNQ